VFELLAEAMENWHPDLFRVGVRVGVLLAENPDGDAVTHGGYPAFATIKIVSLRDRVTKRYDAELLIDGKAWESFGDERRMALVDHELTHLELAKVEGVLSDGTLKVARDDLGRPKLRIRKGDWNVGDGFAQVVLRHQDHAIEYLNIQAAKQAADDAKQAP
jgi:hypothetical protein